MDQAITVGEVVKFVLIAGGIFAVLGVIAYVISAFGAGMSR